MKEEENALIRVKGSIEQVQNALQIASDDEVAHAEKVVAQLKAALDAEKWRREEVEMIESNAAWEEEHGEQLKEMKRLLSEHGDSLSWASEVDCDSDRKRDYWHYRELIAETDIPGDNCEPNDEHLWEVGVAARCKETFDYYHRAFGALREAWRKSKIGWFDIKTHKPIELNLHEPNTGGRYSHTPDHGKQSCRCGGPMHCSYYDPGGPELPGAPGYPSDEVFQCRVCGFEKQGPNAGEYTTGGVDTIGQPLYAHMTTQEVAEMCVCGDPGYGPGDCMNPRCVGY